ncbi:EsV-1-55 [Ectocarpus siliculosus virus 1]|uniref:EsV-1-55 n=1 Tax=Ectocarpus siliculosus virus 1 (isolate New Zealand/Kaikoura/1988) TaxID=654926 RepID=Q8QNL2_ESV1K|nr:EsV-1-55 [Ectocarpus siliculosus virus 1]AAK14481.1 EsV-1-55 [Ectocarpus siliculosus virus 1]
MKYEYTWNHLLLLARVCGKTDDDDSVTASWVQITEEHNRQTFPFTLWPLTYRTCEVTTSPAMCTPVQVRTTDYIVKVFKANEVVIVCIQDSFQDSSCDSVCSHPCLAEFDGDNLTGSGSELSPSNAENHVDKHSPSKSEPLLPCHTAHCYNRMKAKVNDVIYDIQDSVDCVICTGYGEAAAMASCVACDMSQSYEAEKEFLGLETTRVRVDFVGFSDCIIASPTYWKQNSVSIDQYILVVFEDQEATTVGNLVVNPYSLRVTIDALPANPPAMSRSMSVFAKLRDKTKTKRDKKTKTKQPNKLARSISEYVVALNNKVTLPATST